MRSFNIFGESISIGETVGTYVNALSFFNEAMKKELDKFLEDAKFFKEPKTQKDSIHYRLEDFISDIINDITSEGYYEQTKDDYFYQNTGYSIIIAAVINYYKFQEDVTRQQNANANLDLQIAELEAKSKIRGLNFGIISNSVLSHMVYAAQNSAAISKQTKEAQDYYDKVSQRIKVNASGRINSLCEEYYTKIFVPEMTKGITTFYSNSLSLYVTALCRLGKIKYKEISIYNYEKSQKVMQNISYTANKKDLLLEAIKLCPFNKEIYDYAVDNNFATEELRSLAKFLFIELKENVIVSKEFVNAERVMKEAVRMLCENEIDVFDSHWKNRATSYLKDSRKLRDEFPDNFITHGLVAIHTVAANLDNRSNTFWIDVRVSIEKMFKCLNNDNSCSFMLSDIATTFSKYIYDFCYLALEMLKNEDDNFDSANSYVAEAKDWKKAASYKERLSFTIMPMKMLIDGLEKVQFENNEFIVKVLKNDLLYYVVNFCQPYDMYYGQPSRWVRMHLPLDERKYALDVYDWLISQGVDSYDSGWYNFKKNEVNSYNKELGDKPNVLWRGDISQQGRKHQGKLTADEIAQSNKTTFWASLIAGLVFLMLALLNFASGEDIGWGIMSILISIVCFGTTFSTFEKYSASIKLSKTSSKEKKEKTAKEQTKNKKTAKIIKRVCIGVAISIIIVALAIVGFFEITYQKAKESLLSQDYIASYQAFSKLGDYKDSKFLYDYVKTSAYKDMMENAEIGDSVFLGKYEQDDNDDNGEEDIEWIVLDKQGSKLLVISKHCLKMRSFDTAYYDEQTWATSDIRNWLNQGGFDALAFNIKEEEMIVTTNVITPDNSIYGTDGGKNSIDKIFLLSIEEAERLFASDKARKAITTDKYYSSSDKYCGWWLRSNGYNDDKKSAFYDSYAACVNSDGTVNPKGEIVNRELGMRPAMWIDTEKYPY